MVQPRSYLVSVVCVSAVCVSILIGCQTVPPPAAGKAALRISVIAEPKTGVVTGNTHVLAYDSPSAAITPTGQFEKVDYAKLDDIVIWIQPLNGKQSESPRAPECRIDLTADAPLDYIPVLDVGTKVAFCNKGQKPIDLYSVSDGNLFDLGLVPPGSLGAYTIQSAGLFEVWTSSLKQPVATVFVPPTSMSQRAQAGETITFSDLAPGQYVITSWHPRLPGQQITVTLTPDKVTTASIKVGVNGLPKIGDR